MHAIPSKDERGMLFWCPYPTEPGYYHPDPGLPCHVIIFSSWLQNILMKFSPTRTDPKIAISSRDIPDIKQTGPVKGLSTKNLWEFHSIHNAAFHKTRVPMAQKLMLHPENRIIRQHPSNGQFQVTVFPQFCYVLLCNHEYIHCLNHRQVKDYITWRNETERKLLFERRQSMPIHDICML